MLGIPDVVPEREPWMDEVLCAQTDPDLFFPEKGGEGAAAKRVCAECPVAATCLGYALEHGERHGIWGGLTPRQRARLTERAA